MKTRAELKQEAKETLRGRWGTAIAISLLYLLVVFGITMVASFIPFVGGLVSLVVTIPLAFGFIGQMIKFSRNEEFGYFDFFTLGFNNFGRAWEIWGHTILKLLGWILAVIGTLIVGIGAITALIIVGVVTITNNANSVESVLAAGGIIAAVAIIMIVAFYALYIVIIVKSYYYVLANYIGNDNSDLTAKEVVEKSKELMTGNRWRFFVLGLSFMGWAILASLTCGIGYIWLAPYMEVTTIKFYEDLIGNDRKSDEFGISEQQ